MIVRKHLQKNEKVGLRLTQAKRKLIFEGVTSIPKEIAQTIHATPANQPMMMTLDDWDELAGHMAAEANNTRDKKLQKKLDTILLKIQDLLETHDEEEPPSSLKLTDSRQYKPLEWESVKLAELAAKFLISAKRLGIKSKPVARFPLPGAERAVLTMTSTIDEKIQKKLAAKNPKLTVGEVGGLLMAVSEALLEAPPLQQFALTMTAHRLLKCLVSELSGVMKPIAASGRSSIIYRLRITLADIEPAIWRLVEVPDWSLGELHDVIQTVMGWQESHMHQFVVNGKYFGQATPENLDLEVEDEQSIRLSQIFTGKKKPRLIYEYDFGDSWQHEIVLEKTLEPEPKVKYPRCVEGARACPPEDCGGAWGYADFLEALANPKHENHRDMKEWIGGKFDSEKFSVSAVNKELRNV